jgi:HD-GYP domain-containing protein (c-di-GMP phosphodiesterase class II)
MKGLKDLHLFNRMVIVLKDSQGRNTHLAQVGLTDQEADQIREAPSISEETQAKILDPRYRISNSYFFSHDDREVQRLFPVKIPTTQRSTGEWDPADNLIVPMLIKGKLIGYLSADDPADGRIPTLEVVRLLELYANQATISVDNLRLYHDLERSYFDTLKAFVAAMEAKDPYTKGHSENVRLHAIKLAQFMGLPADRVRLIDYSSLLHDIGKIGIKESILNKPEYLTDEEYEEVKKHPLLGDQMVSNIENLRTSAPVIRAHHEHFDGRGYPEGRRGSQIPLEARIISVADAYEAMTSDRPYRKAFTTAEALRRLQAESDRQFDKDIVDAFVTMAGRGGV